MDSEVGFTSPDGGGYTTSKSGGDQDANTSNVIVRPYSSDQFKQNESDKQKYCKPNKYNESGKNDNSGGEDDDDSDLSGYCICRTKDTKRFMM